MMRRKRPLGMQGQTLIEIIMVIVLFSLLLTGANALFWNSCDGVVYGRKLIDITRLGENAMESLQDTKWKETGKWIKKPAEEMLEGFRVVRAAENVRWTGKAFVNNKKDTGYRKVTVRVFPPEDDNPEPYEWEQLLVKK